MRGAAKTCHLRPRRFHFLPCVTQFCVGAATHLSPRADAMPSMFGDQVSSTRRSAPGYGFGSSTRAHAQKVFVSKEHSMLASKGISPGPQYTIRSTVGPQVDGRDPIGAAVGSLKGGPLQGREEHRARSRQLRVAQLNQLDRRCITTWR